MAKKTFFMVQFTQQKQKQNPQQNKLMNVLKILEMKKKKKN